MQLLRITSQPFRAEFHSEAAQLKMQVPKNPQGKLTRRPAELNIRTRDTQVRLDTTEMRASLNLRSIGSWMQVFGDKGNSAAFKVIGESVQYGNQLENIDQGVTVAQLARQRMLQSTDITTYTTFLPSAGVDMSWTPAEANIQYDPGFVQTDWQIQQNVMNYVPAKFSMEILQYPKVTIEYLGKPTYVPPSAEPGYTEESA